MKEFDKLTPLKEMDVFDYLLKDGRERMEMLKHESTLLLFYQDIVSGKLGELTRAVNEELWKIGDKYILQLIAVRKKKGTIRTDVEDQILALFYKGITYQLDEYLFGEIKKCNFDWNKLQSEEIKTIIEKTIMLMKKGMGC